MSGDEHDFDRGIRVGQLALKIGFVMLLATSAVGLWPSRADSQTPQAPDRWIRITSPQGRFSVELPEGWEVKQQDSSSASFGPVGRQFPVVEISGGYPRHR